MHRFFLEEDLRDAGEVYFSKEIKHQLLHVLRRKEGEIVEVIDNYGWKYLVTLKGSSIFDLYGEIMEKSLAKKEPKIRIHLYLSLTNRDKFELILQKCTELGVFSFHPFSSTRSKVFPHSINENKIMRWKKIIKEASEQSGRGIIPEIEFPVGFKEVLITANTIPGMKLVAWEGLKSGKLLTESLLEVQCNINDIAIIIGPEGGFDLNEIQLSQKYSFKIISLGDRILRMETAAIVASVIILSSFNEI